MRFKDIIKKIETETYQLIHSETAKHILRDNLHEEFFSKIFHGEILISKGFIFKHITEALENEKEISLDYITCSSEYIGMGFNIKKFKVGAKAEIKFRIHSGKINNQQQCIKLIIDRHSVTGNTLVSKIITSMLLGLISGITRRKILLEAAPDFIKFKRNYRAAIIDLNSLDFIQSLKKPILGTSKNTLNFISVSRMYQTNAGIILKLKLFK